jgi:hypothetical protein
MTLSPTSELEAINVMLAAIGESPVSTLDNPGLVEAVQAQATLLEVSRAVQVEGWHWNTDEELPIAPNASGELQPPSNTLKIAVSRRSNGRDLVQRGARLWDRRNKTYTINETLYFDLVALLPFDELPEAARRYITVRAARVFTGRDTASDVQVSYTQTDEIMARAELERAEHQTRRPNILDAEDMVGVIVRAPF